MIKNSKDLVNSVIVNYDIGSCISIDTLPQGYANKNYKITTTRGNYLFRVCKEKTLLMIQYEMHLMESLKRVNFPTAFPIQRNDAQFITNNSMGNIVIYEFKSGREPIPGIMVTSEIASVVGKLSLLSPIKEFKATNVINIQDCIKLIDNFDKVDCQYPQIFTDFEEIIKYLYDKLQIPVPKGIVHGDVFPDNTLFDNDKLVAIIDFEEANNDNLLFDVGMTINGFCFENNKLDENLLKIFLATYNKTRPLSEAEKKLIYYYIMWGSIGMAYWHLRHLVKRPLKKQQQRVEELINRVRILQKSTYLQKLLDTNTIYNEKQLQNPGR